MGTSSQAMGLQLSTATRAGFLIQLTSVFVPILGYLAGARISPQVGAAVVLSIMGSLIVTYNGVMANAADATDGKRISPQVGAAVVLSIMGSLLVLYDGAMANAADGTAAAGSLLGERISPQVGAAVVLSIMGSLLVTYIGVMANAADLTDAAGSLLGERISPQVGAAVVLGIMGSLLVTYDGVMANAADATGSASAGGGEVFLLTACLFYSLSVVRLGVHAPRFNSVDLAAVKKFTLCTTSIIWWLSTRPAEFFTGVSDSAADFFSGASNSATAVTEVVPVDLPPIIFLWGIVAYSSLGPGALATFLQTKGQTLVPATQAQIIFSLTPLWGAGIAFLTIGSDGSEAMGPLSWGGGLVMVLASLLASQGSKKEETGSKTA
eukprot:gene19987-26702_t